MSISVIIPAAGCSKRMKDHGAKALVEIRQGETLIERQIKIVEDVFPGSKITVVVGYQAEKVCSVLPKSICIVHNELYEHTNVARSIYLGMVSNPASSTIIVYGDLVFNRVFLSEVWGEFVNNKNDSFLITNNSRSRQNEVGCTVHQDTTLLHMDYGLKTKWCQVALLKRDERDAFVRIASKQDSKRLFGYEIFNKMIEDDLDLKAYSLKNIKLVEIDRPEDILVARKIFQ